MRNNVTQVYFLWVREGPESNDKKYILYRDVGYHDMHKLSTPFGGVLNLCLHHYCRHVPLTAFGLP